MVRSGKIEDIRRLVASAMSMCDKTELDSTRKLLASALSSLEGLKEQKKIKKKSDSARVAHVANPRASLAHVESMIRKEKEKTILPEDDGLING